MSYFNHYKVPKLILSLAGVSKADMVMYCELLVFYSAMNCSVL